MTRIRHSSGRRRRKHDEHTNHEAWAIPYADLLTLLLAFFVVMYAISSVNAGKYRVLSDSLFAAFRGTPRTTQPIEVGERQVGTGADLHTTIVQQSTPESQVQSTSVPVAVHTSLATGGADPHLAGPDPHIVGPDPHIANPDAHLPTPDPHISAADPRTAGKLPPQAAAAAAALSRVADQLERELDQLVKKDMVTIRRNDFWIEVEMRTDILFPSGSARLASSAVGVIERLGGALAGFPNPIRVEGYTDNVPIRTALFSSNWELSAARAATVVRVLANHGVSAARLAVIGYGEQRPLKPNDSPVGRDANRRVVIVILSTEIMRQNDPAKLSTGGSENLAPGAASINTARSAPGTPAIGAPATADAAGATAFPGEAPQARAAPSASPNQPNTGTEPAP